ncbi:DUF6118 family protein [uncultured Sphingomonas sp.]|uniref:DUF6118 family protein n=1 Tax=uncultured Sphingomonas sp. TaxID=158754 RepID=UPI0035CAC045
MDHQVIEAQPDSDADALAAFERMSGQLAMLTAAVEGFAARQARIEQRDYSQDLAQIAERQDKTTAAIHTLADRPGVKLTPDGFAADIDRAAAKLRAPDQVALTSAKAAMGDARAAMSAVVAAARTRRAQRDALTWAAILAIGATALLLALAPLLINALWPAGAEDQAAAILHKSRWEAGVELMASGDPARWRQLVDADSFQHDTAQAVSACRNRATEARRPVRCLVQIAPTDRGSALLLPKHPANEKP